MTTDVSKEQAPAPITDATGQLITGDAAPSSEGGLAGTDERAALKKRAEFMGIQHESNIPTDKLRALVNGKMAEKTVEISTSMQPAIDAQGASAPKQVSAIPEDVLPLTQEEMRKQKRGEVRKEALRLVRVVVTPNNPSETDRDGVMLTVGNNAVGTITQMVKFGEPWHLKNIVLLALQEKQFQRFITSKDKPPQSLLAKAYNIEILPSLTETEIAQLRLSQNAAKVGAV